MLRLIKMAIDAGHMHNVPVSMCGEMAGDPRYTRLLLGMGLTDFSAPPTSLLEVKNVIHQSHTAELTPLVDDILRNDDPAEISELLTTLNEM